MSVNDLADQLEAAALEALFKTKALESCRFHSEITIRIGDDGAERYRCFACGVLPAYSKIRMATPGEVWQCPEVIPHKDRIRKSQVKVVEEVVKSN